MKPRNNEMIEEENLFAEVDQDQLERTIKQI